MLEELLFIPQALYLMLPVYFANMSPVFFAKLFPKWDSPVDFGMKWKDGRPLFGKTKTWRGLLSGSLVSTLLACALALLASYASLPYLPDFGWSEYGTFSVVPVIGFAMGLGALIGDLVKSFFKRRLNKPSGERWFGPDQLDFILGSWLFAFIAGALMRSCDLASSNWIVEHFFASQTWPRAVFILASILLLHPLSNWIACKLKLKDVPW
jgi:CDP-2,3-bis-(O-geranylgeranyl)-sn-glycerol synthase